MLAEGQVSHVPAHHLDAIPHTRRGRALAELIEELLEEVDRGDGPTRRGRQCHRLHARPTADIEHVGLHRQLRAHLESAERGGVVPGALSRKAAMDIEKDLHQPVVVGHSPERVAAGPA